MTTHVKKKLTLEANGAHIAICTCFNARPCSPFSCWWMVQLSQTTSTLSEKCSNCKLCFHALYLDDSTTWQTPLCVFYWAGVARACKIFPIAWCFALHSTHVGGEGWSAKLTMVCEMSPRFLQSAYTGSLVLLKSGFMKGSALTRIVNEKFAIFTPSCRIFLLINSLTTFFSLAYWPLCITLLVSAHIFCSRSDAQCTTVLLEQALP